MYLNHRVMQKTNLYQPENFIPSDYLLTARDFFSMNAEKTNKLLKTHVLIQSYILKHILRHTHNILTQTQTHTLTHIHILIGTSRHIYSPTYTYNHMYTH